MTPRRIGLIGGMSWESTATYYTMLNQFSAQASGAWHQPRVLIDSLDFSEIVALQRRGDWDSTATILEDSAKRLERGGASILAITANTMHMNYDRVACSVKIPVVDIREAILLELRASGATSLSLLGTKYVMASDFFSGPLEAAGIKVVVPEDKSQDELQRIIYDELTRGVVLDDSRAAFVEIAEDCRRRGGDIVGLCCTEFAMLFRDVAAPFKFIDSTSAHVRALLAFETSLSKDD
jgi:aspartate racemase